MSINLNQKKTQRALLQPFMQTDLEWRIQSSGDYNEKVWARIIAYVTNRAIQQRLDDTVGIFKWKNEFNPLPNSVGNGALCGLSIKFDGEWITKYDGADNTNIESTKGGLSGAMKRAAVQFGIGRYLYDVEAHYAECINQDTFKTLKQHEKSMFEKAKTKNNKVFYWKPPTLDDKFLPKKYIGKDSYELILKLIEETDTNKDDICKNFGVDDLRDLYTDEAGQSVSILMSKKKKKEEDAANEKNKPTR